VRKAQNNFPPILLDDTPQLNLQTVSQQDPYLTQVVSKSKLTDTESFEFIAYFQPEVIYIHSLNSNKWNKADYTHPAAGQLGGLKDPMAFWLSLLKHAQKIEKTSANNEEHYTIQLLPFNEEIHGLNLTDVANGVLEIWAKKQPFQLEKMKVEVALKPDITRGYDHVTYLLNVTDQGKQVSLSLPKEAEAAERLR
jgi:hypothetical protein